MCVCGASFFVCPFINRHKNVSEKTRTRQSLLCAAAIVKSTTRGRWSESVAWASCVGRMLVTATIGRSKNWDKTRVKPRKNKQLNKKYEDDETKLGMRPLQNMDERIQNKA